MSKIPSPMDRPLASPHLNSKVLMDEFRNLTTRPQYTMAARGEDITEATIIINACRIEETNQYRLELAARVLGLAITMMEFELQSEHRNCIPGPSAVRKGDTTGGYN